jgi:hypothetical protein
MGVGGGGAADGAASWTCACHGGWRRVLPLVMLVGVLLNARHACACQGAAADTRAAGDARGGRRRAPLLQLLLQLLPRLLLLVLVVGLLLNARDHACACRVAANGHRVATCMARAAILQRVAWGQSKEEMAGGDCGGGSPKARARASL